MDNKIFKTFVAKAPGDTASRNFVKRIQRPRIIEVETVNICNARCGFCPYKNNIPKRQEMPAGDFEDTLNQISEYGTDELSMVPMLGDPLLDTNLMERFLHLSHTKNLKEIRLVTNGLALNRWSDEDIVRILNITGNLEISLGPNREVYKEMFGIDRFEHLVTQLERLADLMDTVKNKPRRVEFCGRACGDAFKVDARIETLSKRLCTVMPVFWRTEYLDWGGTIKDLPLGTRVIKGEEICQTKAPCTYALMPHVYQNGDVGLCASGGADKSLIIGSLKDNRLQEILTSDKRLRLIFSFLKNKQPDYCRKCSFYRYESTLNWENLSTDFEEKNA